MECRGSRAAGRRVDALYRVAETLTAAERDWSRNTRGMAARI